MPTALGAWFSPRSASCHIPCSARPLAFPQHLLTRSSAVPPPQRLPRLPLTTALPALLSRLYLVSNPFSLQVVAEAHFPYLETQAGALLHITDHEGKPHAFRLRFWINNQSRWVRGALLQLNVSEGSLIFQAFQRQLTLYSLVSFRD
jgi:hypothetical protein